MYLDSLNDVDRNKVEGPLPSSKIFKFGNNEKLPSVGKYKIPVVLAGQKGFLELDVVSSDIPLLLSKNAMKKAKMKLDVETDTCVVFGKKLNLLVTNSGHYCLPLTDQSSNGRNPVFLERTEKTRMARSQNAELVARPFIIRMPAKFLKL